VTFKQSGGLAVATGALATDAARAAGRFTTRGAKAARSVLGKLKGAGWALTDQCVVSAANFLTIFLFARFLEASTFGGFALAYTGLLLLTNLQNALVVQPHNVLAAGLAQPEYRRFTTALGFLQALYCLTIFLLLGAAGLIVATLHSREAGNVVLALAITAVPWMGQEFMRRVFYTRGQSRSAAINNAVTYGLQLFGALVLVLTASQWSTPASALSVLGLSSFIGMLVGAWQLREHFDFSRATQLPFARTWSEVWGFGKWLTAQNVLAWFGAQGHSWILAIILGIEQVGVYRAVTHLVNVMNPVLQTAFSYLPSRGSLARHAGGVAGLSHWVKKLSWLLPLALLPFCIVLVIFPGAALELAYGGKYSDPGLAWILALTAMAQVILFSKFPFDIGLLALRSTKSIFYAYLVPVILLLTCGVALIHFFGLLGVPLSGILINSALLATTWLAYRQRLKESA